MAYNTYTSYDVDVLAGTVAGATGAGYQPLAKAFTRISPEETPFYSHAPTTKAYTMNHEWVGDSLAAAATNKAIEGADHSLAAAPDIQRYQNYCTIARKDVQVTGTQQATNMAGNIGKLFAFHKAKAMKELKRDCEVNYFQLASAAGASGTARGMQGIAAALRLGNSSTSASDRALTLALFNAAAFSAWNDGAVPERIYVGGAVKQALSKLASTAYGTRFVKGDGGMFEQRIEIYNGDLGMYDVIPDRFCDTNIIHFIDSQHWKRAVLRPVQIKDVAPTGDGLKAMVLCEETLEYGNPSAGAILDDVC